MTNNTGSRGEKLLRLVLERRDHSSCHETINVSSCESSSTKRNSPSDEPFDDTDEDPDYNPEDETSKKRKIPQYFKDKDLHYPGRLKSRKFLDYKDKSELFPSPEMWEHEGLTASEKNIAIGTALASLSYNVRTSVAEESVDNSPQSQDQVNESAIPFGNTGDSIVPKDRGLKKRAKATKTKSVEKLNLFPSCQSTCRKKCSQRITSEQRQLIFDYFKKLDYGERQLFFDKHIIKNDIKYRKVDAATNKKYSISYNLPFINDSLANAGTTKVCTETEDLEPNETTELEHISIETNDLTNSPSDGFGAGASEPMNENTLSVCKTMFIHTIGFKTDGSITNYLKRSMNDIMPCLEDKRGKRRGEQMKHISQANYKIVKDHIDSYHPVLSHYNLAHTPYRRYLPADLTIRQLHKDFNSKHTSLSYESYRKFFEKENIGFSAPTQDDCSVCSVYKQHVHDTSADKELSDPPTSTPSINLNEIEAPGKEDIIEKNQEDVLSQTLVDGGIACSICENFKIHKQRYIVARQKYNEDTTKLWDDAHELYAVDMQKVLIIPKMTIKNSFFVSRLVVFHETFANLKPGGQNKCVLWHEAVMGRNGPDVASAYYNALMKLNDGTKHVIFWADNCTAQNKNWVLFTACIIFVNENWGPESITFKYFEPGHSFMKADSIHGQIGKKWNKVPDVLDFEDLKDLIESSNKHNKIISLRAEDFLKFENASMQRKKGINMPKLMEIKSAQFRKGSRKLYYKSELEHDDFIDVAILKPKFKLSLPETMGAARGMSQTKKDTIVKELLPHMPPRKRIFWENLPSSGASLDLAKNTAEF